MFVREADHAYDLGPASARPYLDHAVLERALLETGADAAWVGWGFVAEDAGVRRAVRRGSASPSSGPSAGGDAPARRQDRGQAASPSRSASRSRRGAVVRSTTSRRRTRARPADRLPADAQGDRGRRRPRHPGRHQRRRARRRLRPHPRRGAARLRQRRGLPRAARDRRPARRGAGHRRRPGHGVGARRPGLLGAAPQPEGHRGVGVAGARRPSRSAELKDVGRAARARGRLPRCGHRRVPLPAVGARVRLPRGQHPAPGRAPGHRARHRHRPRQRSSSTSPPAAGSRASRPTETGHAIEARLNAEDPDRDFAPAPGRIALLRLPVGPGVRVDTGVAEGDVIPADFDSMIAKIIAYGPTRDEAAAPGCDGRWPTPPSSSRAGRRTRRFILDLLDQPEVVDGSADTGWIDRVRDDGRARHPPRTPGSRSSPPRSRPTTTAERAERLRFLATAHGGRPQARHDVGRAFDLKLRGVVLPGRRSPRSARTASGSAVDGHTASTPTSSGSATTPAGSRSGTGRYRLVTATHGADHLVEVDGVGPPGHPGRGRRAALAGARARRRRSRSRSGDEVEAGRAGPRAGEHEDGDGARRAVRRAGARAARRRERPGRSRASRSLRLEPAGDGEAAAPAAAGRRPQRASSCPRAGAAGRPASTARSRRSRDLRSLHARLRPHRPTTVARRSPATTPREPSRPTAGDVRLRRRRDRRAVGVRRPLRADPQPAGRRGLAATSRVHSPREYFHTYLHSLDVDRERLPERLPGPARPGARALRRRRASTAPPRSRRRCSGSSWPSSGPASHLPFVTALLQRWLAANAAVRERGLGRTS